MDFDFHSTDNGARITLTGRLTFGENAAFRRIVERLDGEVEGEIVFDLADMDYIDSAGLGMLMVAREEVVTRGGTARIANAHGHVGRMLELARFGDFFAFG